MRKVNIILLVMFFMGLQHLYAQYPVNIVTGRPGAANGAGTVGKGILQFQTGIQYSELNDRRDSVDFVRSDVSENLVIRFGLRETFEVSAVINHSNAQINRDGNSNSASGINTSLLRARSHITNNLALQVGVETRLHSQDYKINYFAPQIKLMYNSQFTEKIALMTNLGVNWDGNTREESGFYVFSLSTQLSPKVSLIAEAYGNFRKTYINNYFDAGIGYLVNKDFLIDVNAGWGRNFPFDSYFVTSGISYRLKTRFRNDSSSN